MLRLLPAELLRQGCTATGSQQALLHRAASLGVHPRTPVPPHTRTGGCDAAAAPRGGASLPLLPAITKLSARSRPPALPPSHMAPAPWG